MNHRPQTGSRPVIDQEVMSASGSGAPGQGGFPATHWSIVLNAGVGSTLPARAALETLCRQYWYPLYAFARRRGRSDAEAQDVTQEFFARLLANAGIARARQERGRFRTFLLTAFSHFLTNAWRRANAAKRGGGVEVLPCDFETANRTFAVQPVDPAITPERAFDRNWATGLMEQVIGELHREYERSGRGELFAILAPLLWGESHRDPLAVYAAQLGMSEHALTMARHRLRNRLGQRLRARVAETVADPADVEDELRYLVTSLAD